MTLNDIFIFMFYLVLLLSCGSFYHLIFFAGYMISDSEETLTNLSDLRSYPLGMEYNINIHHIQACYAFQINNFELKRNLVMASNDINAVNTEEGATNAR